jgi:hypothetical protein
MMPEYFRRLLFSDSTIASRREPYRVLQGRERCQLIGRSQVYYVVRIGLALTLLISINVNTLAQESPRNFGDAIGTPLISGGRSVR